MLKHIVLWTLKTSFSDEEKDKAIATLIQKLDDLPDLIPFIREFCVVRNINHDGRNMDIGLISAFDSLEDLGRYALHPEHKKVAEYISTVVETRTAIDYEI
ncbi:MAG: Dabb family protein [Clostridiaceae bacterium]|nr:Dabb family protein [Clostridiaceae bacterium]